MKPASGLRRGRLFSLTLVALMTLTAIPALADPEDRLDEIQRRKARAQERVEDLTNRSDELSAVVRELDERARRAQDEVNALDAQLDRLNKRISEVKADLADAQIRLTGLSEELQLILARLDYRLDAFTARAVAAYKAGPTAYMEGLVTSRSFAELSDRVEYYESALDADSQVVEEIGLLRDETEIKRDAVEKEREEISTKKLQLESDKVDLARIRQEKASVLAARKAVLDEKQSLLSNVLDKKEAAERIVAQLEADAASITSLLAAQASSAIGPLPTGGGQLLWPAAGPLTSGYGYRTHPIFGDSRLHTGIDIGAGYGATIISAQSGSVVFAGVMSGYGNAVVIDHGGGLASLYAHMSAFGVSDGQAVGRGIPIGNVGCSGYCTGPHLHFEVRVNGNPVDPMPYLQ